MSRCQAVTFYGLPVEDCRRVIAHNQPEIGQEEARLLAENALRFNIASNLMRSQIRMVRSAVKDGGA